jgi:hypothetical protein
MDISVSTNKNTRELLVEALGVNEQLKAEYTQLKKQNDALEQMLKVAEDKLLQDN